MCRFIQIVEDTLSEVTATVAQEPAEQIIAEYAPHLASGKPLARHSSIELKNSTVGSRECYGLFSGTALISLLVVIDLGGEWQIGRTATLKEYTGQGWMRYLITWFVHNVGPLYSDISQTDDAIAMWKSLIARPGDQSGALSIFLASEDGSSVPLKIVGDQVTPDPWDDSDSRILVTKKTFTNESIERYRKSRELSGREIRWYGEGTSDERYWNP